MRMVTRVSTVKFRNIDVTLEDHSDWEGQESRLQAREHGREPRLEKAETAAITDPNPYIHEEF